MEVLFFFCPDLSGGSGPPKDWGGGVMTFGGGGHDLSQSVEQHGFVQCKGIAPTFVNVGDDGAL